MLTLSDSFHSSEVMFSFAENLFSLFFNIVWLMLNFQVLCVWKPINLLSYLKSINLLSYLKATSATHPSAVWLPPKFHGPGYQGRISIVISF